MIDSHTSRAVIGTILLGLVVFLIATIQRWDTNQQHSTAVLNRIDVRLDDSPRNVNNRVTIDEMTKLTKYKYDEDDNLILSMKFCYDGTPEDRKRIAQEWQDACDDL